MNKQAKQAAPKDKVVRLPTTGVIMTTKGEMDLSDLDREIKSFEDDNELTQAVEYRIKGSAEIVRRDVHVQLKKNVVSESIAAAI